MQASRWHIVHYFRGTSDSDAMPNRSKVHSTKPSFVYCTSWPRLCTTSSKAYCNSLLQNYTAQGNDRWQPLSTMRLLGRYHTRRRHFHSSRSAAGQHSHCWKYSSTTNAITLLVHSCSAIWTQSNTLPCPLYHQLRMLMRRVVYKQKATKWAIKSSPVFFAIVHSFYLSLKGGACIIVVELKHTL